MVRRHEDGMFYNRVLPDLIVGSCPQTPEDVDWLADYENVKAIFSLQQASASLSGRAIQK